MRTRSRVCGGVSLFPCPSTPGQRGTQGAIPACRVGEWYIYPFRGIIGNWGMVFGASLKWCLFIALLEW